MAAPIYRPGVEHRAVYLPDGTWYDWWTGEKLEGATHILAHASLERMTLYARAGAVIPMQPVTQYVDEHPLKELQLRIFPGNSEYTLYEDDGNSFEYQKDIYATTKISVSTGGERVIVNVAQRQGKWKPEKRQIIVEVVGFGKQSFEDEGNSHRLEFSDENLQLI